MSAASRREEEEKERKREKEAFTSAAVCATFMWAPSPPVVTVPVCGSRGPWLEEGGVMEEGGEMGSEGGC